MGLQIQVLNASTSHEINAAFATFVRERPDAIFVSGDGFFNSRRVQLVHVASHHRLPATYGGRDFPDIGGLIRGRKPHRRPTHGQGKQGYGCAEECGVGFRQLRTFRHSRPGQLWANSERVSCSVKPVTFPARFRATLCGGRACALGLHYIEERSRSRLFEYHRSTGHFFTASRARTRSSSKNTKSDRVRCARNCFSAWARRRVFPARTWTNLLGGLRKLAAGWMRPWRARARG